MNLEPAMRVSRARQRETRRERERVRSARSMQLHVVKGFLPSSAVYLVLESWHDKKMLVLSNRLGSFPSEIFPAFSQTHLHLYA